MPRRAKVRPDEPGRERLLESALELFGERGYHATSVADVGERAGITKSVLYHYFGSKAGLYQAVAEAQTAALLDHVAAAVSEERRNLRAGIDAYLGFLAARPGAWRLLVRDPPAEPALIEVHERLAGERLRALAELLTSDEKRRTSGGHVDLVATAIRVFAAWWYDNRDTPRHEITEAILDFARVSSQRVHSST